MPSASGSQTSSRNGSRACSLTAASIRCRKSVVVLGAARNADDGELLGQQSAESERVDRGDELALREVAGRAEDDEHARIRRAPQLQPLEQRVLERLGHSLFTAWPPNSLRSAAVIFAAYDSSCREAKRAKSAAVITGTGTSSAIASWIVQRPSPESST